jgi:hypothetical protein
MVARYSYRRCSGLICQCGCHIHNCLFGDGGIITLTLAIILLILAWVVVAIGSFFAPRTLKTRDRISFLVCFAVGLFAIGIYETMHFEPPPTAASIAREVVRSIPVPGGKGSASIPVEDSEVHGVPTN